MAPELSVVAAAVALPFLGAAAVPVVYRLVGERTGYVCALIALGSVGLVGSQFGTHGTVAAPWIPSIDVAIRFHVDGWALLFALLASGIGVLVFTYSAAYMHGESNLRRYYATLLAFMGSILGVAFAADLLLLFLFWELTSVCSFVLIGHYTDEEASRYSARMAMLVTVGGGLGLLIGAIALAVAAEAALGGPTFDLAAILAEDAAVREALRESGLFVPVLGLFTLAAAAKSAQVPLHFWLPNAMVAPTPISAFLHSATMVKVGVYFLGRVRPLLVGEAWTLTVATLGLATMTVGALLAVVATDIKRLLAYSTASHLGLMVAGFGFASHYGAETGVFHLLNHALFKAALFLVAGIVAHEVGTRHLPELGGLWRDLPVTAAVAGVAGLSMAGIPPFNGFYSKELLFEATWEAATASGGLAWLYPAVATAASVFTVLYSLRFLAAFVGKRPAALPESIPRPPLSLLVPPALLAVVAGAVGLAPMRAVEFVVGDGVAATAAEAPDVHVGLPTYLSGPVVMSIVAIVVGVALYPVAGPIRRGIEAVVDWGFVLRPTWWYGRILGATETASARVGALVHNGRLRTYVTWVVLAAAGVVLVGYLGSAVTVPAVDGLGVSTVMALVLLVAVIATVAVVLAPSHVAGVLTLGILGFMIAIFYILASGPDLALTQLVVETLLLLVFLLVLEELPSFYSETALSVLVRDLLVSLTVGATVFLTVLVAARDGSAPLTDTARFYVEEAVHGAGGSNVVNVVLTDFRGFDTLGEIIVVTVAALSVLVLLSMRTRGESQ